MAGRLVGHAGLAKALLAASNPFRSFTGIHASEGMLTANILFSDTSTGQMTFSNDDSASKEISLRKYL